MKLWCEIKQEKDWKVFFFYKTWWDLESSLLAGGPLNVGDSGDAWFDWLDSDFCNPSYIYTTHTASLVSALWTEKLL